MTKSNRYLHVVFWALSLLCTRSRAYSDDVVNASPGKGTLSAALASVSDGGVVNLTAGEYTDSIVLRRDVSIQGAGADKTFVTGLEPWVMNCQTGKIVIRDLEVRGRGVKRGIHASTSIRVERVRFRDVEEGIGLAGAPLSDIVCCEFIGGKIGIRSVLGCPTVWGCRFQGMETGILSSDGSPFIFNNLIFDVSRGVVLLIGNEMPIVRNNMFVKCNGPAIDVRSGKDAALGRTSIRNNIFEECEAAVVAEKPFGRHITHAIINKVQPPAFRDREGRAIVEETAAWVTTTDPGIKLEEDGSCRVEKVSVIVDAGIRLCTEPKGTRGILGLMRGWERPGCKPAPGATLPSIRMREEPYLVNAVMEEYQCLGLWGLQPGSQSISEKENRWIDTVSCKKGGVTVEMRFDCSRFYSEDGLRP